MLNLTKGKYNVLHIHEAICEMCLFIIQKTNYTYISIYDTVVIVETRHKIIKLFCPNHCGLFDFVDFVSASWA